MSSETTVATAVHACTQGSKRSRPVVRFALHYVEMVVVMIVGMMVLYPLWELLVDDSSSAWVNRPDIDALVMATTMVIPMALWMRFRGHAAAPIVEMSLAMYGGFVVLLPFQWTGAIDEGGLMLYGHVLMFLAMLGAMLARRDEYAGHRH